jgi:hypothetical protein
MDDIDNMLLSMATCLGIADVAMIKIMEQGQASNVIRVFHADQPTASSSSSYSSSIIIIN